MRDGQAWTPEPRREKSPASNMALLLWGLRSPAWCPLSWATCLQGQVHRSSRGAQLPRTEELGLSAVGQDNPKG